MWRPHSIRVSIGDSGSLDLSSNLGGTKYLFAPFSSFPPFFNQTKCCVVVVCLLSIHNAMWCTCNVCEWMVCGVVWHQGKSPLVYVNDFWHNDHNCHIISSPSSSFTTSIITLPFIHTRLSLMHGTCLGCVALTLNNTWRPHHHTQFHAIQPPTLTNHTPRWDHHAGCSHLIVLDTLYVFVACCHLVSKTQTHTQNRRWKRKRGQKDYDTWCSQVVSNPSTNQARKGLTSLIRREVVLSSWYGRNDCFVFFSFSLWSKMWMVCVMSNHSNVALVCSCPFLNSQPHS